MVSNSDLAFLITTLVAVKRKKKEKRKRRWSKEWYKMRNHFTHEHLLNFLCDLEPKDYRNYLRMDQESFYYLLDLLRPDIEKKDTKMHEAIPASQSLSITLRYLSSGMDLEDLKFTCAIAPQTLHLIIMETCSAIIKALKENIQVEQRDVPGIDCAYLAMDTEEGVEVVWNEVQFSERKNFKAQEDKIQQVFENLTQLEHPNIVKFHRYWTDTHNDKPRVIFITEYMSSGSLKQFLKRTKRNVKKLPLQAWKRWCTQILSALSYLHSCSPPIIHGNLTCDTIFIQHNGLVKIGSVAPDAINHHVKTYRENMKNMHFIAPEYGVSATPSIDVYSFGMCALEMAALEIQGNGDSGTLVTDENIMRTIESLDDPQQKDFIAKCLVKEPKLRPQARDLLFHPLLFEVHPLKLLAAHALVYSSGSISETITDEVAQRLFGPEVIVAEINHPNRPGVQMKMGDVPVAEKLEKFIEDVKYGIYPLTAYTARQPPPPRPRAMSPEMAESVKSVTPEPVDVENRRVVNMMCNIKSKEDTCELLMTILLRMDDKMNRQLTCLVSEIDTSLLLAQELVHFGFINEADRERLATLMEDTLRSCFSRQLLSPETDSTEKQMPPLFPPSAVRGNAVTVHSGS